MSTLHDAIVHRVAVHGTSGSRLRCEIFEALKMRLSGTVLEDLEETSIVIIRNLHIVATAYFCRLPDQPLNPHDCITLDADISQDSLVLYC